MQNDTFFNFSILINDCMVTIYSVDIFFVKYFFLSICLFIR